MHQNASYVIQSLELNLFFARIMKEHALFLKAGLTPAHADFAREAAFFQREFEHVLARAVSLGDGAVTCGVLHSGELFTEFTLRAETQTAHFTGIPIRREITRRELRLRCGDANGPGLAQSQQVRSLNRAALRLVRGLIAMKERMLGQVLGCRLFTMNYPLLIEHILREARLYEAYLCRLEQDGELDCEAARQTEQFWNRIMMEHAMFIRGLLDPSESALIEAADTFAEDYARLLESCRAAHDRTLITGGDALAETLRFRDFKAAGVKGIADCQIRSVILPLLADHVLREANHYIRLLGD